MPLKPPFLTPRESDRDAVLDELPEAGEDQVPSTGPREMLQLWLYPVSAVPESPAVNVALVVECLNRAGVSKRILQYRRLDFPLGHLR